MTNLSPDTESNVPERPSPIPVHISDAFALPDHDLLDPESGRWHAARIAEALGIPLKDLALLIGAEPASIRQQQTSAAFHESLAPFANILARVRDYYSGDEERVRGWLSALQSRLGGRAPLDALREGNSVAMEQWIAGVWLGDGE